MYKTILCATDGSDSAGEAVAVAATLAKAFDSKLVFLHVVEPSHITDEVRRLAEVEHVAEPRNTPYPDIANVPSWITEAEAASTRASDDLRILEVLGQRYLSDAERTAKEAGIKNVEKIIGRGHAAKEILTTAKDLDADAIVLGARGLSDLSGILMGSVSHKVTHYAPCTCITVR